MSQDTGQELPVEQKPESNVGMRVLSAVLSAAVGGGIGHFVGSRGDNNDRKMAQRSFAVIGAVFGALLAYFATKKQDVRAYDMTGAPTVLRQAHPEVVKPAPKTEEPETQISAVEAEHKGMVEMAMAQAQAASR